MITVVMHKKGGRLAGFSAHGHADYAPEGQDIVCSGVSSLTQAAVLGLEKRCSVNLSKSKGKGILCELSPDCAEDKLYEAHIILDTMLLGLRGIEQNYKGCLCIKEKEV